MLCRNGLDGILRLFQAGARGFPVNFDGRDFLSLGQKRNHLSFQSIVNVFEQFLV